jgi:hypothetical protein
MAATWAAHNIAAYFVMGQSAEATIAMGLTSFVMFSFGVIATARRRGIKVPAWIAVIAEAIIESAQQGR